MGKEEKKMVIPHKMIVIFPLFKMKTKTIHLKEFWTRKMFGETTKKEEIGLRNKKKEKRFSKYLKHQKTMNYHLKKMMMIRLFMLNQVTWKKKLGS